MDTSGSARDLSAPVTFSTGSVLSVGFSVFLRNAVPFLTLTLIVYLPVLLYTVAVFSGRLTLESLQMWVVVVGLAGSVLQVVVSAAVTHGTIQDMRGTPALMGASIAMGIKRLIPVLLVGLLAALCICLGFMLLIIPGFMVMCALWVAAPVAVVENPGVMESLRRSADLTRGYRWQIFGVVFVIGLISVVLGQICESVLLDSRSLMTYAIVVVLLSVVTAAVGAVMCAVGYFQLRNVKDGATVDELAATFD